MNLYLINQIQIDDQILHHIISIRFTLCVFDHKQAILLANILEYIFATLQILHLCTRVP